MDDVKITQNILLFLSFVNISKYISKWGFWRKNSLHRLSSHNNFSLVRIPLSHDTLRLMWSVITHFSILSFFFLKKIPPFIFFFLFKNCRCHTLSFFFYFKMTIFLFSMITLCGKRSSRYLFKTVTIKNETKNIPFLFSSPHTFFATVSGYPLKYCQCQYTLICVNCRFYTGQYIKRFEMVEQTYF